MKCIKCDLCGKAADKYLQIKYRLVDGEKTGASKYMDVCEDCRKKELSVLKIRKE